MSETFWDYAFAAFISLLSNLQFIVAMLTVVLVAACFLGRYIVLTRKLVFSSFGVLAISVIGSVIMTLCFSEEPDSDTYYVLNGILTGAIFVYSFVFYLFAYKEKRILRAIESTVCFYLFTSYIGSFSQLTLVYFLGGTDDVLMDIFYENLGEGTEWLLVSSVGLIVTVALFVIVYLGFYRRKKYFVIGIPYRIVFVIWVAIFTVLPSVPAAMPADEYTIDDRYMVMSFLFAIGVIILGLAMPVFVIVSTTERALKEKNKSQETYIAAELEYIGQYKKKQVETQQFRHDIKNNLALTQMMLDEGHVDEAREHVRDMLGNVSSLSPKYVTGDEMLDLIVSMKADRMEEMNIRFTLDGVADGGLGMKPMDMCSIFANALDNAIEAASSCKQPYVSLNIKRTDKFFVIKITNSASKKVDIGKLLSSSGYTSKSDKEHHGFGLMNVRRATEDCDGILKAESDDESFTLSIMLPREK
ncbi:sensor histidine kinase [Butyrivibrio sp. AE2032]|uniref:sensor histidine kinase n=1 Tax=Butyrivibrio sp. AE2032 TaxID=1458463 RepID=UPI00054E79DF|nr:sensor histidine kinase [Butyrivibrio sp. AE2032]